MNTSEQMGQEPPNRKLAAGLGLLTSLALLISASVLASDLIALLGAEQPPAAAPFATPAGNAVANTEMTGIAFLGKAILVAVSIVALAVTAPLIGVVCLFGILWRYGKHLGLLIRVEYLGHPSAAITPLTANSLSVADPAACIAQQLNFGPTFEDERRHKAEQINRMASGLLGQIFEDNVKLRELIEVTREKEKATTLEGRGRLVPSSALTWNP